MSGGVSALARRVVEEGCAVEDGVLDGAVTVAAAGALEEVFADEDVVAEDRGWTTATYRVAYALPVKHPTFLELCTHPGLLDRARGILGEDCVLAAFNGLAVPPGGVGQALHRDHPVPTPGTPLYLHLVCALDAFTVANGATRVVPRSHVDPGARRPPSELEDQAVPVEVAAGGVVAFDGSLVHAAGPNRTDRPRRALHVFFARRWVQPHWDFPGSFPAEVASALSEEQREVLGFTNRPRRFDLDERRVVR